MKEEVDSWMTTGLADCRWCNPVKKQLLVPSGTDSNRSARKIRFTKFRKINENHEIGDKATECGKQDNLRKTTKENKMDFKIRARKGKGN